VEKRWDPDFLAIAGGLAIRKRMRNDYSEIAGTKALEAAVFAPGFAPRPVAQALMALFS